MADPILAFALFFLMIVVLPSTRLLSPSKLDLPPTVPLLLRKYNPFFSLIDRPLPIHVFSLLIARICAQSY